MKFIVILFALLAILFLEACQEEKPPAPIEPQPVVTPAEPAAEPALPVPAPPAKQPAKAAPAAPAVALKYRSDLTREAQFKFGITALVPVLAAQIEQESGWRADVTAWDNGRGLAQFMDPTADWAAKNCGAPGPADPYNPKWAMRAMICLDAFNTKRVKADTECDRWGAGLKAYNAGLGYILRAQKQSDEPGRWFGLTEQINAGQSAKNFEYSRQYPRWIIGKRQPKYSEWGRTLNCEGL